MTLTKLQPSLKSPSEEPKARGRSGIATLFKKRAAPRFKEHTLVRALREIREGTDSIPAGATGTIVHVLGGGVGYQVEFTAPKHLVISARPSDLVRA